MTEPMAVDDEFVLEPRDCVAAHDAAGRSIHTGWNASHQTAITIETYLFDCNQPGRTFVDSMGIPVP